MIFLPLASTFTRLVASASVCTSDRTGTAAAAHGLAPRTTEASDGTYRRESPWPPTPPRHLAALCGPELRLGSGSGSTTERAAKGEAFGMLAFEF
jgi:hypothetical protein